MRHLMIPFTGATNVSYKVEIYTDLKSSKPTDGQLQSAATTTGTTTSKGIYTKLSYNGSNRSPKPVIKTSSGTTLVNGTDYTYTYNKSTRKKTGTYKKLRDYSSKYTGVTFSVGKNVTYWYKTRAYKKVGNTKIYGPFSTPKAFKR